MAEMTMEMRHIRMAQTEEHLLKAIDKIFHRIEDSGRCLTSEEVCEIKNVWEAIHHMDQLHMAEKQVQH